MDLTHIHLLLNHVPVLGVIFGFLLLAYALIKKSRDLRQASLSIFVFTGLISVVVYLTGEPAEETVEHLAGVSETMIESHEEAALLAMVGATSLGAIALGGLLASRWSKAIAKPLVAAALLGSLIVSGLLAWTANLGGQIRHSEIRSAPSQVNEKSTKDDQNNRRSDDERALLIYPLVGNVSGNSYPYSPTFGVPCPTTIFTFGLLLWADKGAPRYVILIPLLWSLIGMFAAVYLGIWADAGLPVAGIAGTLLILRRNRQAISPIHAGVQQT